MGWNNVMAITSKSFVCGYCSNQVASNRGYEFIEKYKILASVHLCPHCGRPTFFEGDTQVPGSMIGQSVDNVPKDVGSYFNEARRDFSVNSYTSCVLICRKIIMNVAVDHGAEEGKQFAFYINYLMKNNYIGINSKSWVDKIRTSGNDATHKLPEISSDEARNIISFTEMLLITLYKFKIDEE